VAHTDSASFGAHLRPTAHTGSTFMFNAQPSGQGPRGLRRRPDGDHAGGGCHVALQRPSG